MTFFVTAATLITLGVNVVYLRLYARASERRPVELLPLILYDLGLLWMIVTQASQPPLS